MKQHGDGRIRVVERGPECRIGERGGKWNDLKEAVFATLGTNNAVDYHGDPEELANAYTACYRPALKRGLRVGRRKREGFIRLWVERADGMGAVEAASELAVGRRRARPHPR